MSYASFCAREGRQRDEVSKSRRSPKGENLDYVRDHAPLRLLALRIPFLRRCHPSGLLCRALSCFPSNRSSPVSGADFLDAFSLACPTDRRTFREGGEKMRERKSRSDRLHTQQRRSASLSVTARARSVSSLPLSLREKLISPLRSRRGEGVLCSFYSVTPTISNLARRNPVFWAPLPPTASIE